MLLASLCAGIWFQSTILIRNGTLIDGSGARPIRADIRITGNKISQIGKLKTLQSDQVVDAKGMVVTPGFIDAHSHADMAMDKLESQIRQGITTAVVGQDGYNPVPISQLFSDLKAHPALINFATFSGHGTIRESVMGTDFERPATESEIKRMAEVLAADMKNGAIGISTGLEYDPGHYSDTNELIALSRVAAEFGGMYISHVRDEGNGALKSFDELIQIAKEAGIPAQISHIKLATAAVWHKSHDVLTKIRNAKNQKLDISADVYPYTYWQSTITALTVSRDFDNPKVWEQAISEVGGATNIRLTKYVPNPNWQGKTLDEIAKLAGASPAETIIKIVNATKGKGGQESILCHAMNDQDLEKFIAANNTMICSDGTGGGSHPRSAGAFPRVFREFVIKKPVLTWQQAVRKMTSLPALRFRLGRSRGQLKPEFIADIVILNSKTIQDLATPSNPTKFSVGIRDVFISGIPALRNYKLTTKKSGKGLIPEST